jgi:hypothetical protein
MSKYTLDEIAELIAQDGSDDDECPLVDSEDDCVEVSIIPPIELNCETGEDSDISDDGVEGLVDKLPLQILKSQAEIQLYSNNYEYNNDYNWINDESSFEEPHFTVSSQPAMHFHSVRSNINSPFDSYKYFFDEELVSLIVVQSNQFATLHNINLSVSSDEIYIFFAILLFSGYNKIPQRRMYWSTDLDFKNNFISTAMPRKRFEQILKYLHFADNSNINDDNFYKVRPLFDYFNCKIKTNLLSNELCIDEAMVKYYGHHTCKQYMQGKPVKFGYKIWCLASSSGYIYHGEPYCGAKTNVTHSNLGQGADVVLSLLEKCDVPKGSKLYFDNYFTSIPLLVILRQKNIAACGTIRANRTKNCTLTQKKVMKTFARGHMEARSTKDILVVHWMDSKPVIIASNYDAIKPIKYVTRWNKKERKRKLIKMPNLIAKYNKNMGGVDLFDQMVSAYRIKIRSKKWYWALFSWILNALLVNSWRLYQDLKDPKISLLDYLRSVVIESVGYYQRNPSSLGRKSSVLSTKNELIRHDGKCHWPINSEIINGVCIICRKRTRVRCEKCDLALHIDCFKKFHCS